ncbi:MAG: ABC transporter substrate-binding protein [Desulfobulbus sp.]
MKRQTISLFLFFCLTAFPASGLRAAESAIKLGVSASASGSFASVGASIKNAIELAQKELEAAGGLKIGEKVYGIEPVYVDNGSNNSQATANVLRLIGQKQIIAIVGPMSSDRAIPVGEVANAFKTPMVTPWSTSPLTTLNRPYVFRMPVMYDIQAVAMTKFATKEWKATKAAVLYDEVSPYPTGMAKSFKKHFEAVNGTGSVVAFETFRTGQKDFSKQLTAILNSGADFLYTPQHYEEVPLIVRQAKKMGWKKPIAGSNSWAGGDLMGKCGDDCKGFYFTGNFAPGGTVGIAKVFVEKYQKAYNRLPDEPAALTYDAVNLIAGALQKTGGLTGNIVEDRTKLQKQLAVTKNFMGVTGALSYQGNGDPAKCAVIIKIDENGIFTNAEKICP